MNISLTEAMTVINKAGFNLMASPRYVEFYIARALNGEVTEPLAAADVILTDGTAIEVKTSKVTTHYAGPGNRYETKIYKWKSLLGENRNKVGKVDYYVLVGVQDEMLCEYWLIPADKITKHTASARPYQDEKQSSWLDAYYKGTDINNIRKFFTRRRK